MLQSGVDAPAMEGCSVEEVGELNELTNQKVTMGDTALARHQGLIERQMGNIIKCMSNQQRDELKQKLEETENSHNNSDIKPILHPPLFLETQDNLDEPKEEEDNIMLEVAMEMQKIRDS